MFTQTTWAPQTQRKILSHREPQKRRISKGSIVWTFHKLPSHQDLSGTTLSRERQCHTLAIANISPAKPNVRALCSDIEIKDGKVLTRLASVAPMPSATRAAGKAQHTSVPKDVKSDKKEDTPRIIYPQWLKRNSQRLSQPFRFVLW